MHNSEITRGSNNKKGRIINTQMSRRIDPPVEYRAVPKF
jgi:hypothetical protein